MFAVFRHFLAVAILCAIGYAYQKHQMMSAPAGDDAADAFDPFAEWNQYGDAPGFGSGSDAIPFNNDDLPDPIPFPETNARTLPTDLVSHGQNTAQDVLNGLAQPRNNERQSPGGFSPFDNQPENLDSSRRPSSKKSLWDEPVVHRESQSIPKFQEKQRPSTEKQPAASATRKKGAFSAFTEQLTDLLPGGSEKSKPAGGEKVTPPSQTPSRPPAAAEFWRQFTLGSGQDRTVCVIDESVSRNPLLLSAIFTGLRREWLGTDGSRTLEILVEHPEGGMAGPESRLSELNPTRVVRVVQGNEDRGWMRFSSEEESIAALVSVPGTYRVSSLSDVNVAGARREAGYPTVEIELPQSSHEGQAEMAQIMHAALMGNWTPGSLTSTPRVNKSQVNVAGKSEPVPEKSADGEAWNPFEALTGIPSMLLEMEKPKIDREQEPSVPIPTPEPERGTKHEFVESLPTPGAPRDDEPVLPAPREGLDGFRSTDEYLSSLLSDPTSRVMEHTQQNVEQILDETRAVARKVGTVSKVEVLQPPPIFQDKAMVPKEPSPSNFFRLPPPPSAE
ncbi:hypothetical protein [Rubinisphaera margarita]|uniref:hypothetical protein n=1 Tax=Rubinisphaera margarita TaxID=2909586 RepID=UPI001EE83859|nr:hypothetical protein [Rubinisphaera margarita]MCG6157879.1 hypothetical protein [Rubinisphaera margarita]